MFRHKVVKTDTEYAGIAFDDLPESKHIEKVNAPLDAVETELRSREPYLADPALIDAVKLAMALGRPLLLQGDPGTGKTRLAYAVAYELGMPLEVAYIKSTSQAQDLLYTYDAVRRLYDVQMLNRQSGEDDSDRRSLDFKNYVRLGPLGRAIARAEKGRRSVVLIDEIDKADLDFPNDLLWELDRLEFKVEGATGADEQISYAAGNRPELRPIVFITHNEEKALPSAFLRRCIFHYIEFPNDKARLAEILDVQQFKDAELTDRAIDVLLKLRAREDLIKKPGLSELLDWVGYLEAVQMPPEKLDKVPMIGALLKQRSDQQRVQSEVQA